MRKALLGISFCTFLFLTASSFAQEKPYFVLYSQDMEEPGNLDIESFSVVGNPKPGNAFLGSTLEFEYGVKTWWTSEFYLDGQATQNDSTIFTGFRWENRFRPLMGEHPVNPVLYVEYENTSADKSLREIVGHDGIADFFDPNSESRADVERELELKLILGSNVRGWNISENFIAEKNLTNEPWEFGYADRSESAPEVGRKLERMHVLPREISGRCGDVWRPRRLAYLWIAPDFAIPRALD